MKGPDGQAGTPGRRATQVAAGQLSMQCCCCQHKQLLCTAGMPCGALSQATQASAGRGRAWAADDTRPAASRAGQLQVWGFQAHGLTSGCAAPLAAAEQWEHAYNFRFEEPGAAAIITYPRNVSCSWAGLRPASPWLAGLSSVA